MRHIIHLNENIIDDLILLIIKLILNTYSKNRYKNTLLTLHSMIIEISN